MIKVDFWLFRIGKYGGTFRFFFLGGYNKVSFIFLKVLINWINLIYTNSIYKTVQLRRILIKKKAVSKLNLKQPSLYIEVIAFLLLFRSWQQNLSWKFEFASFRIDINQFYLDFITFFDSGFFDCFQTCPVNFGDVQQTILARFFIVTGLYTDVKPMWSEIC